MALSADGAVIAVARHGGEVGLVDADSLQERRTVPVLPADVVTRLGFVPGGHLLVVGGETGGLALLDADSGRVRRLGGHRTYILSPGFSADGRLLVTAEVDGIVRLWSLPGGRPVGPAAALPRTACTTRSSARTAAGSRSCCSPRAECPTRWRSGTSGAAASWLACASATTATSCGSARTAGSWRWGTTAAGRRCGRPRRGSRCPPRSAATPARSAVRRSAGDGGTLATGGDDGMVRLWDIETGRALGAPLPGVARQTVVPSFTTDGTHLLAAYETGDAYLWDIRPESLVRQACRAAGRRLTRAEWDEFLPGRDYEPAC